jgi:hypothetical protein
MPRQVELNLNSSARGCRAPRSHNCEERMTMKKLTAADPESRSPDLTPRTSSG